MAVDRDSIQVLHIDDEPDFAEIAAEFLRREDERIDIEIAVSADAGLERIAGHDFDCVVSDYDMPGMNGIELLETVRSDHPELPFILYTGKGSEEVASEAISKGVTDYLQKGSGTDQYTVLANRVTNAVERAWAERDADRIRSQLQAIVGNTNDAIVTIDTDSTVRFANPAVDDLLGYSPGELEGEPLTTLMPSRYHDDHFEAVDRYLETGERTINWQSVEFSAQHRDGHEIPVSISFGEFEQDAERRFVGILRDISDRIRMEAEQRERETRFRQMAENIEEVVWMSDPEKDEMIYVNPAYEAIWGRSVQSLYEEPESFLDAVHPEDRDRVEGAIADQHTGGYDEEYRVIQPDGEVRWVRDRAVPVENEAGEVYRIVGIASDITERVERERELERYERLVEAMGDAVYTLDPDGRMVEVNQRFEVLTGYDREDLLGEHVSMLLDKADIAKGERTVAELLSDANKEIGTYEETVHTADGGTVRCEVRQTLLPSPDGGFQGTIGTLRDITDRKARERELEQYKTIVQTVPVGVFVLDEEGNIVEGNGQAAEMLGYAYEDLVGERFQRLIEDGVFDSGIVETYLEQVRSLLSDETDKEYATFEHSADVAGEERFIESSLSLRPFEDEYRGTVGVMRDITEQRRQAQELRRQKERLEEFASVLSHDLRNPLTVADGNLELAVEDCDSEYLHEVAQALDRMETLIQDTLALAKAGQSIGETEYVDLPDLIESCWGNVNTASATLVTDTDGTIEADRTRLQQLLENLFRNAVEHGGDAVTVTVGAVSDGFYVEDDGPGIPADERDAVLQLGTSTTAEGSGFGLSIVREIADAHGWDIAITEGAAGGARFEITGVRVET